ncbi:hypothetical protein CAPTEDRAFT_215954 [Capitella teleta]|uniref:L1 transposable element RRM domain-containing protein n=1 Tax=Capitella teleta TaxID=283909 RepID=R7V8C7_CAPTE|nr:hypothetical protein CAPTEDRAFT_215954 [Capitella teleta]|eukprot:ELU15108.1 hypothetical protein CAPTEDRAFT_215954 [Capitella teleta]
MPSNKKKNNQNREWDNEGDEMEREMTQMRKDIAKLLKQQDIIMKQQNQIDSLLQEIATLKTENKKQKKKEITLLTSRVDDLEQYTRSEDIIISGLRVQNRYYSKAAATTEETNENAADEENLVLEKKVVQFMNSKDIHVREREISACHFLGGPGKDGIKKIIVRFTNRKDKVALLKQGQKLNGGNVYVNEHLTRKNASLARIARVLRTQGALTKTWTRNGRVFTKWKSHINVQESVTKITNEDDFLRCNISKEQLTTVCAKLNDH